MSISAAQPAPSAQDRHLPGAAVGPLHRLMRTALACLAVFALLFGSWARADEEIEDPDTAISVARRTLETIQRQLQSEEVNDSDLATARHTLYTIEQRASAIVVDQSHQLDAARARLAELGQPAPGEAPDVAARRDTLQKASTQIDARVKLARLLAVESVQLADKAGVLSRARFQSRLFERTDSILTRSFWEDLRFSLVRDWSRLMQIRTLALAAPGPTVWGWIGLTLMVAAAVALRMWLGQRLGLYVTLIAPKGRVRRSFYALVRSLLAMLVPAATAYAVSLAVSRDTEQTGWNHLFDSAIGAVCFSSYIVGLGHALLQPNRPSWRLVPIPDRVARGMRSFPLLLGIAIFVSWLLLGLASLVQAGLPTAVAIDAGVALTIGLIIVRGVSARERLRRQAVEKDEAQEPPLLWWHRALIAAAWLLLVAALVGILLGYVALGGFVVRQAVWITVVVPTAYLLITLIDDVTTAWLAGPPAAPGELAQGSTRAQAAVLASGGLRLFVLLVALVTLFAPFGEGPSELMGRTDQLRVGMTVGELRLRPTAVLQAVVVFALTLWGVKALQRWLADRFLPTTSMDVGMRTSLVTLLGFVGVVVAVALGLSAVGLALDKVAWIASALTVGIGFGMQAVISNFVSGLILLAERPVKVGDWVVLGNVEGDIRRINVRATEIRMGDRSTVIVPNSEFITKVVRNVTHDDPLGVVQIMLPLPLDTDVEHARAILLDALLGHEDVLADPAPSVMIDGIVGDHVVFNATGYVTSPRKAYAARSAVLFRALAQLHLADPAPTTQA